MHSTKSFIPRIMKQFFVLITLLLAGFTCNAQVLLFETFNDGIPSEWKMFNDENTAHHSVYRDAWATNTQYGCPAPSAASTSWFLVANQADRWMILQPVLINSTGLSFAMEARCLERSYPDGFEVRISTRGDSLRTLFEDTPLLQQYHCDTTFHTYYASLDDYVGDTVWIAIVQNSDDMNLLLVDNVRICNLNGEELELTQINVPTFVQPDSVFHIGGRVTNRSQLPLTGFSFSYTIDGTPYPGMTIRGINVINGEYFNFEDTTSIALDEGYHEIEVTIASLSSSSQDFVDNNTLSIILPVMPAVPTAWERHTLIEQFADANNTISGHLDSKLRNILSSNDNLIWIAYHPSDQFSNAAATQLYNTFENPQLPAVAFDRAPIFQRRGSNPFYNLYAAGVLASVADRMSAIPAPVGISISECSFNPSARYIQATINGASAINLNTKNPRLTVLLVEDSVWADGYGSYSSNSRTDNVVRGILYDEPLSPLSDSTYQVTINGTIPPTCAAWRCKIVAFISNDDPDITRRQVFNADLSEHFEATYVGIQDADQETQISLYPNPATDRFTITSQSPINAVQLFDMQGKLIKQTKCNNRNEQTISVENLRSGLYIVAISTAKGQSFQRISVLK